MADLSPSRFTPRALFLGGLISLLMAIGAPYSRYILHTTPLVFSSFPWGVMALWLILILVNSSLGHRLALWRPLTRWELLLIFIVAALGSSMTTSEMAGLLVTNIAGLNYYATPENRWMELFGNGLPHWALTSDNLNAVRWLFDGAPAGVVIPWGEWKVPLFWNLGFGLAVYAVQFGAVALFRKQWVEYERLTFPILQIPIQLASSQESDTWLPSWMQPRLFWIGFALPFTLLMLQAGHWFWPVVPQIPTDLGELSLGREYPPIPMRLFWPIVGISYFVNAEIIFSLWFFKLAGTLVTGLLVRFGALASTGSQPMNWVNTGALFVMVGWLVWQARRHLLMAARTALGRKGGADDSKELVSYRTAYILVISGLMYMIAWLMQAGMSLPVALLITAVAQALFFGISRLALEAGVMHVNAPLNPCHIVAEALGPANLSATTLAGIALTYWKFTNIKSLFLVNLSHAAALSANEEISGPINPKRKIRPLALVAVVVVPLTTGVAIWYTLHLGYSFGGYNFNDWIFRAAAEEPYASLKRWITDPQSPQVPITYLGSGALLMGLVTAMRYMFVWWPLHPIGLAVCFSYHISHSFLSFLIAWAVKSIALKIGGIDLYRKLVPMFLGIIVGSFLGGAVCFAIDYVWFPLDGHTVFYR